MSNVEIKEWKVLNHRDFESFDMEKTIVLVSCSPLEVHGPHLPTFTDMEEADLMLEEVVQKVDAAKPGFNYVMLPAIYTATDTLPHVGSLQFRPSTVYRTIHDLGWTLASQGFKHVWVANFHGGPRHILAIEQACHAISKKFQIKMVPVFSLVVKRLTSGTNEVTEAFSQVDGIDKSEFVGDMHGGMLETSLILLRHPNLVTSDYKELPSRVAYDGTKYHGKKGFGPTMNRLKDTLLFYHKETYSGHPQFGTKEKGEIILDRLTDEASTALQEVLDDKLPIREWMSPLWPFRHVMMVPFLYRLFERWCGIRTSKHWK